LLTASPPAEPLTLAEFAAALASLALFERRPRLAVAVSGGPDSLSLVIPCPARSLSCFRQTERRK